MEKVDLFAALSKQVEVDLQLVKGWEHTESKSRNGVYFVNGMFTREDGKEHVVVPFPAGGSIAPSMMDEWMQTLGTDSITIAVVELDGAISYFELRESKDAPNVEDFPKIYKRE